MKSCVNISMILDIFEKITGNENPKPIMRGYEFILPLSFKKSKVKLIILPQKNRFRAGVYLF